MNAFLPGDDERGATLAAVALPPPAATPTMGLGWMLPHNDPTDVGGSDRIRGEGDSRG